ncbi:ricin-like [Mercurialis annua]|uniref:ricin-like n=1 Tax=Mercurialis annua TaxID=3986 RepID=UPI0021604BBC|nr:ricin-like [Mercurialis annua]
MEGKMSLQWISYLIAAWLWCSVAFGTTLELSAALKPNEKFLESYEENLKILRDQSGNSADLRHGIPVLFHKANLPSSGRFFTLTVNGTCEIKLVIDKTNVKMVAFIANTNGFIYNVTDLDDAEAINGYVANMTTQQHLMPFSNNYDELEKVSEYKREDVLLGYPWLIQSIDELYSYQPGGSNLVFVAASTMRINQLITEAGRFREIELLIRQGIRYNDTFKPTQGMIDLQDKWENLSRAVQESGVQGAFRNAVQIVRHDGSQISIDNVRSLMGILSLMPFQCDAPSTTFSPLIRSVVPNLDDGGVCEYAEPTVCLVGRNHLCITLGPFCGRFTLKRDGTIRTNGVCLGTNDAGDSLTATYCPDVVSDVNRWELSDDGTCMSRKSGLVLAATATGALFLQNNSYTAGQSWLATNSLAPFMAPIYGIKELCLQSNETDIWLTNCTKESEQLWAFYADGSLRPMLNQINCLSTNGTRGSVVKILSCDPTSSGQRWLFKNDGSIWSKYYRSVLDVSGSKPERKRILLWGFNGNANQKWTPLL